LAVLTVQEAADRVRLTQWAIYRAIHRGDLVAFKPGGRLRIEESDLTEWLESTRVEATPRPRGRSSRVATANVMDGALRPHQTTESLRARVRAKRGERSTA
jgi:excisionase family DNA binding protein